jgi:hypothetical protein
MQVSAAVPADVVRKPKAKKLHLFQHATGVRLATIHPGDLNAWCDAYGYLPHRKVAAGYVVIAQ